MNLIIFGATGMVGKQLVKQALYKGHHVKAFGRNVFTEEMPKDEKLQLIQGALFDEKEVRNAITGCDAVLSALGGAIDGTDFTRSLGMKNIVAQMKNAEVNRIVAVGGLGILDSYADKMIIHTEEYPKEYLAVGEEHLKAYEFLKESNLKWTFVCPPDIKNTAATGAFITNANFPPTPNKFYINSGDLAFFMINELIENAYIQQRVGISN